MQYYDYYQYPVGYYIPYSSNFRQPTDLLGNVWHEQEGAWRGIWTRRGNSNIFDARWTKPGSTDVTAVL
ncbi:hypothetical protein QJ133_02625 [Priestia megaterium]|uniref:hypothetical protein n=1 Tax=Priestia megaterium TaxID=1404 RepID=UPI00249A95F4|nr:hypothetical protein [Priestia megaterium]MDI3090070.1 hypothetical protein [Priestia megaterium]